MRGEENELVAVLDVRSKRQTEYFKYRRAECYNYSYYYYFARLAYRIFKD